MESAQISRLQDDLQGVVRGELLFDDLSRVLYGSDASLFEVRPAAVVVPRDEEDLCALVRYAGENQIPLIPRGAGSGLAGETLGAGLVVDLSIHFRDIVRVGDTTVEVEPGVTLAQLNGKLREVGRRFSPDPDHAECTIGGMLATNASGPRAARLGTTREHVEALRVVLDSGDAVDVGRLSRWPTDEALPARLADIVLSTVTLLDQNADLLRASAPQVKLDRVGYALHGILGDRELDLARLLVGSEGTLGLFTRATLRTEPIPDGRAVVLIGFARIDAALRAARLVLSFQPTACELLDRRLLRLARGEPSSIEVVPEGAEAVLLVEFEAGSQAEATATAREVASIVVQRERTGLFSRVAESPTDTERLWHLRLPASPELHALRRAAQPVPLVEDMAVPPDRLPDFLPRVQDVLRRHDTTASFLIRPMTGQVMMRPFLDLQAPLDSAHLWALADELYTLALAAGGTVSSAQGTGLARLPWVGRQLGRFAPMHREIKSIFDPRYLFNPGKVIAGPTQAVTWPLRSRNLASRPPHQLVWTTTTPVRETLACNGCGTCRTTSPAERMCPIFRAEPSEAATPRAKANLMRYLLQPDTDPALLSSDQVRAVADLCVNCKMCARECPSRVQIPRMMLEAKAANVARFGLDRGDWAFARTESFAWLGSALAPIVNAMLANPSARWFLERIFNVSRKRRLPHFAARSFLHLARKRGWTRKPRSARPRVAYFVDVFANYNDPLIAESVVAVLHHNGIEVYVPPGQLGSGMAPLAYGDVDTARDIAQHNVRVLADLAREGFPILCSEPTAALMLRHDALDLLDDSDAALVAAQVVESTAYLWDLHQQGQLKTNFNPLPISIGHHIPCHLKALGRPPAGPALLGLIPGVRVGTIDLSCSGMAGTFGFKSDNYDISMKAGEPMLRELSGPAYLFGSTECSSCRLQMEDGTGKRTLHPVQYLALALGLVPGLLDRLREPIGRRVLQ